MKVKVLILVCTVFSVDILQSVKEREINSLILCMSEQWCFRGQLEGTYNQK